MSPIAPFMPPDFAPAHPLPGEHRRLLFFGIVRAYKGLDVALRALAKGPADVRLRVVGEFWGGTSATVDLVAELGLTERVELRPCVCSGDEVADLFADVDAMVLPYRTVTGSQGVWTAFQFGVPVLVTEPVGSPTTSHPASMDWWRRPDDVDSLAQAIDDFYQPGVPERMRDAVRPVDPVPYWDRYVGAMCGRFMAESKLARIRRVPGLQTGVKVAFGIAVVFFGGIYVGERWSKIQVPLQDSKVGWLVAAAAWPSSGSCSRCSAPCSRYRSPVAAGCP